MIAFSCSLEGTDGLHGVRDEGLKQLREKTFFYSGDLKNSLEIIPKTIIVIANTEQFTEVHKIK